MNYFSYGPGALANPTERSKIAIQKFYDFMIFRPQAQNYRINKNFNIKKISEIWVESDDDYRKHFSNFCWYIEGLY